MPAFAQMFLRVEESGLAGMVRDSVGLAGLLSGIHLIGLTLVVGGVLVSSLRLMGVLFADRPVSEVLSGPRRGIRVGLLLSILSGGVLLAPRIATASGDRIFQIKMLFLLAAMAFHFSIYGAVAQESRPVPRVAAAGLGLTLWLGVAAAGCAFILFN